MAFSYNNLWKNLIDHGLKKGNLCSNAKISSATMAKMSKGEPVSMLVIEKICKELDCRVGDVIEYVKDSDVNEID